MGYDGGFELSAEDILNNKWVILFYFAVLLVLIVLIVWYFKTMTNKSSEHYYGYGMPNSYQVLASGPDVRFQEFTGTNQGDTPVNMATIKQMYPGITKGAAERMMAMRKKKERMTASQEPPVFYDISQQLGEYQYASQF